MTARRRATTPVADAALPRIAPISTWRRRRELVGALCASMLVLGCSDADQAKTSATNANDVDQADATASDSSGGIGDNRSADAVVNDAMVSDTSDPAAGSDAAAPPGDGAPATDASASGGGDAEPGDAEPGDAEPGDTKADSDAALPCDPSTGKKEICNGVDDDCDGQTDEGAQICDDGNVCTIDEACAPSGGSWSCVGTPVDGPCDDNDICTGGEACSGGVCTGGFVAACNDMNECTSDSCDSSGAGCTHEPVPGCGLPCTMGKGECPKPNYCDALVPLTCSGAGRCTLKPDTCTGEVKPVCGCDDTTYSSACLAAQAGVPVQSVGACPK